MSTHEIFDPVTVFYSYSHADEKFRDEIQKHLATLGRLGLIREWHDRRIGPGDAWKCEIHDKLERADIILLLISPDFIASNYCYEIEAKRALERHEQDEATVIPILLRPLDTKGLPFSKLQMLPRDGRSIISHQLADLALKEVAEGIRSAVEKVVHRRVRRLPREQKPSSPRERRILEGAVAQNILVGEFRDVVGLIRLPESPGLRELLSPDREIVRTYSCQAEDVRAQAFEAKYSLRLPDELISPEYSLQIHAPSLVTDTQVKKFVLEPMRDSGTLSFLVKPELEGVHRILINLYCCDLDVSEVLLSTSADAQYKPGPGPQVAERDLIASVELVVRAVAKAATSGAAW